MLEKGEKLGGSFSKKQKIEPGIQLTTFYHNDSYGQQLLLNKEDFNFTT